MRMTKKVTALAMTAVLTASALVGCGGNDTPNGQTTTNTVLILGQHQLQKRQAQLVCLQ